MGVARPATGTSLKILQTEQHQIRTSDDIVIVRQAVRKSAVALGLGLVDQTKFVTAASELCRNTLDYGGGGTVQMDVVTDGRRSGLRLIFTDEGPGIPDIALALRDGYTSGQGMGLGLGGAKRLSHEFEIASTPGVGTRVMIARWK
jgi:serine/threonine-protein kinase RsbT